MRKVCLAIRTRTFCCTRCLTRCWARRRSAALGDIGKLFPDTDDAYLGADSRALLREVVGRVNAAGFVVGNIDATVLAQAPKLRPFIDEMRANIAADCRVDVSRVNVKATTEEGLGFTGEGLGMAAHAVCILEEGSEDEC